MAVILTAAEAAKYKNSVFYLQCKPLQEIVIRCDQNIPRFDTSAVAEALGYSVDTSGNISASFHRGESGHYEGEEFIVNELYDLDIVYQAQTHSWHLTVAIDNADREELCQIKNLKLAVPIFLSEITDFVMRFACHACQSCIESMLAIDLGNTRSCMLLCEDVRNTTHASGIQLHKVPLISYTDNKVSDVGVFDSFVSFSEVAGTSFTRIGKEAIPVANNLRGSRESGDFYLSSPKRYYWDDDDNLNGWKAWGKHNQAKSLEALPMARKLSECFPQTEAATMPRSSVLAGMFMEILEQTEAFINNSESYAVNKLPKLLTHVCVTYPSGWSIAEQERYQVVLEKALKLYASQRCGNKKDITLDVSCDEASAVLLCYIYGEISKYSGKVDSWLEAVGRTDSLGGGTHARIAVIDVGGGTSDLAIVNLQNMNRSSSNCHLRMDKLYKDGTNKAGDLMLRNVVKRILLPRVAEGIVSKDAPKEARNRFIERFGGFLNNLTGDARVKQLSRRFWFPLAIDFLQAVNSGKRDIHLPDALSLLVEILKDHAEDSIRNNLDDSFGSISIESDDKAAVRKIVTQTFRETAKLFGAAIYAFDADIVILSGKTTENSEVARIFQKYCYLPKSRFIPMWNYMIGDWCTVADAGRISDSKYTTAIGASLYSIINQHYPIQNIDAMIETGNVSGINDGNCYWGIANNGNFDAEDAVMYPGRSECWIPFSGHPKLLARRRFNVDSSEIAISYELRLKPFKQQQFEWKKKLERYSYDMMRSFAVEFVDVQLAEGSYLLVRKDTGRELRSTQIKVVLGRDLADDSHTAVIVREVEGLFKDGSRVTADDIRLYLKPRERELQNSIDVKLQLYSDVYGRADITVEEVNGKYSDGALVTPDDLELRIKTSDEGLFWLDSGKI